MLRPRVLNLITKSSNSMGNRYMFENGGCTARYLNAKYELISTFKAFFNNNPFSASVNFHVNCFFRVREIIDPSNNWVSLGLGTT